MHYSQEEKLLIKLSRLDWKSVNLPQIDENLNLEVFLDLARENGILLYALERLKGDKTFREKALKYDEQFRPMRMLSLAQHLEFDLLSRKFAERSIPLIPIKGILLSKILYPKIELRDMMDIDVIVKYSDAPKLSNLITELNYRQIYSDQNIKKDLLPLLANKDLQKHIDCIEFKRSSFNLELHFKMLSSKFYSQIPNEEIWDNACKEKIGGQYLLTLSPEHQLINLATHCAFHNLAFGLRAIAELDGIIEYYGLRLNWDKFYETIERHDLIQLSYIPLFLSKQLYDAFIPEHILEHMKKKCGSLVSSLCEKISQNFFQRFSIPMLGDDTHYFQIIWQKKWLSSICKIFFPPLMILKLKAPEGEGRFPLIYLQYPLRLLRLIKVYSPTLIKRIFYGIRDVYGKNN